MAMTRCRAAFLGVVGLLGASAPVVHAQARDSASAQTDTAKRVRDFISMRFITHRDSVTWIANHGANAKADTLKWVFVADSAHIFYPYVRDMPARFAQTMRKLLWFIDQDEMVQAMFDGPEAFSRRKQ
jgi:hypothetical protein